jgi:hypothetical protein
MTSSSQKRKGSEGKLGGLEGHHGADIKKKEQREANPAKMEMGDGTRRSLVGNNRYRAIIL